MTTTIARPESASSALFVTLRNATMPSTASIHVAADEKAVFVRDGMVQGMLGPGTHSADPSSTPFLYNLVPVGGGDAEGDILFVRTTEHGWWEMRAEPHPLDDVRTGARALVRFTGYFSVQVDDAYALASVIEGPDDKKLYEYIESKVDRACRDVATTMTREGIGIRDLCTEQHARALADRTIAKVAADLVGQPIRVVRFGSLLVNVE